MSGPYRESAARDEIEIAKPPRRVPPWLAHVLAGTAFALGGAILTDYERSAGWPGPHAVVMLVAIALQAVAAIVCFANAAFARGEVTS